MEVSPIEQFLMLWYVILVTYLLVNFSYIKQIFSWFFIVFVILLQIYLNMEERENNILIALSSFNFMAFNFMAFKIYKYKKNK